MTAVDFFTAESGPLSTLRKIFSGNHSASELP